MPTYYINEPSTVVTTVANIAERGNLFHDSLERGLGYAQLDLIGWYSTSINDMIFDVFIDSAFIGTIYHEFPKYERDLDKMGGIITERVSELLIKHHS